MMYMLNLPLLCLLGISITDGACPGGITTFDYRNTDTFTINLKPNPQGVDAKNGLKGAPPSRKLSVASKKQTVVIASKGNSFSVEQIEFEFSGVRRASVKFMLNGQIQVQKNQKGSKKDWTKVSLKLRDDLVDTIILSFKISRKEKVALVRNILLQSCLKSASTNTKGGAQKPPSMDKDEYVKSYGLGMKRFKEAMILSIKIKTMMAKKLKLKIPKPKSIAMYDILMTPKQLQGLYKGMLGKKGKGKRAAMDSEAIKEGGPRKWDLTVPYAIDSAFNFRDQHTIKKAIDHWEEKTCIRFRKVPEDSPEHHIRFTKRPSTAPKDNKGEEVNCLSFIGKNTDVQPQPIFLTTFCLRNSEPGVVIHMIGHTLGFVHESKRGISGHIEIQEQNVLPQFVAFLKGIDLPTIDVFKPYVYDYNSFMHFTSWAFGKNGKRNFTIKTRNPLYQHNIGQEVGLSYYDRRAFHDAYCSDICKGTEKTCERKGYPNPNQCSRCVCPTGFSGHNCSQIDIDPETFGRHCEPDYFDLTVSDTEKCVNSPNYNEGKRYFPGNYCNWHLKAPEGKRIQLEFKDRFQVLCRSSSPLADNSTIFPVRCYHWVEVKLNDELTTPGFRFCCNVRPKETLVSEKNEALVSFDARFRSSEIRLERLGFKLCYKAVQ